MTIKQWSKVVHMLVGGAACAMLLLLVACGSGSSSTSTNPGGSGNGGGSSGYLKWSGNANGVIVIDATGNQYQFSSTTGCMYMANGSGGGPANFCLTVDSASASGFADYGPTNCLNPQSNSECSAASFDVVLTNNPTGSGCIAVLGNGGATTFLKDNQSLSVESGSSSVNGFVITVSNNPTAYTTYFADWSNGGRIPQCGGSSPYAGTYSGTWNLNTAGNGCYLGAFNDTLTIDSGGILYDENSGLLADIGADGTGIGDLSFDNQIGAYGITIMSATKDTNGNWVISGIGTGYTGAANCGSFALTQM